MSTKQGLYLIGLGLLALTSATSLLPKDKSVNKEYLDLSARCNRLGGTIKHYQVVDGSVSSVCITTKEDHASEH